MDEQSEIHDFLSEMSSYDNVYIIYGPMHREYPNSERVSSLQNYFSEFKHLKKDEYYYKFLNHCPMYLIDNYDDVYDPSREGSFSLCICPLEDEGFFELVDEGLFIFCNYLVRFHPGSVNDEDNGIAEYHYALKFEDDQYKGIFREIKIWSERSEARWQYYCDNFYTWLLELMKKRGNFLELDDNGSPC